MHKIILDNVPDAVVEALHDEDHGFAKVLPLELLNHIFALAKQVETICIQTLLKERDQHMEFEGKMNCEAFFIEIDRITKNLKKQGIETS